MEKEEEGKVSERCTLFMRNIFSSLFFLLLPPTKELPINGFHVCVSASLAVTLTEEPFKSMSHVTPPKVATLALYFLLVKCRSKKFLFQPSSLEHLCILFLPSRRKKIFY